MKNVLRTLILSSISVLLLSGCNGLNNNNNVIEDMTPTSISISKESVNLNVNQTVSITATLFNENNHRCDGVNISWTISDDVVASIVSSYNGSVCDVSAKSIGQTSLMASYGNLSITCLINVVSEYVPEQKTLSYTYDDYIKNNVYNLSSSPSINKTNLLIIPVWFTDSSDYINVSQGKENVRNDIVNAYLGSEAETGWQSVKSYYENESRGKLSFNGVVSDWYECGYKSTYFYSKTSGGNNTMSLVSKAVNWYKTTYNVSNLSEFDCNKDGYLDGVMLIYGAPDSNSYTTYNNDNMWAYCYWLQNGDANISNPTPNVFFWASYDFMYSSTSAIKRTLKSTYGGGDNTYCNVDAHTFIHEMGHVFGLEDYYDYSSQYNPAGGYSMQDCNVGSHDPFSRLALGWEKVYVPTKTSKLHINPFEQSGDLILLSSHNESITSPFDEYILVELYSPLGLNEFDCKHLYASYGPQGPNKYGIRIWHIDARLLYFSDPNTEYPSENKVTSEPISGKYYTHMMSNTYYSDSTDSSYYSPLGSRYANYNILQLIRADGGTYKSKDYLSSSSLFIDETFSMSTNTYYKQFVNSTKLNDKSTLGWTISFSNVSSSGADVSITKL